MLLFKRIKPQACGTITYQGRVRPGGGKGEQNRPQNSKRVCTYSQEHP